MKLQFPEGQARLIGRPQVQAVQVQAAEAPRRRALVRYHEHEERVQRMLNAIDPDSYVRPHRHQDPAKTEVFLAVAGAALVLLFDESGQVTEAYRIQPGSELLGVEVPPGRFHAVLALEAGTVLYEVLDGPYEASCHKDYAPWAPAEADREAGQAYLEGLKRRLARED